MSEGFPKKKQEKQEPELEISEGLDLDLSEAPKEAAPLDLDLSNEMAAEQKKRDESAKEAVWNRLQEAAHKNAEGSRLTEADQAKPELLTEAEQRAKDIAEIKEGLKGLRKAA